MTLCNLKMYGEVIVAKPVFLITIIDGIEQWVFQTNGFPLNEWGTVHNQEEDCCEEYRDEEEALLIGCEILKRIITSMNCSIENSVQASLCNQLASEYVITFWHRLLTGDDGCLEVVFVGNNLPEWYGYALPVSLSGWHAQALPLVERHRDRRDETRRSGWKGILFFATTMLQRMQPSSIPLWAAANIQGPMSASG